MTPSSSRVRIALRGTLIALVVAGVIGAVVLSAVMVISGRPDDGLRAAIYVALGYLAINLILLVAGLIARPSEGWAVGAALATPVVIAALGFGYAAYLALPSL